MGTGIDPQPQLHVAGQQDFPWVREERVQLLLGCGGAVDGGVYLDWKWGVVNKELHSMTP